jgi:hypothetical protein
VYKTTLFPVAYIPHDQQCKNTLNIMGTSLPTTLAEGETGKILKCDLSQYSHVLCYVIFLRTVVPFVLEALVVALCKSLKMRI